MYRFCFFYCWVALLRRALVLLMPKVPKAFRQKRRWLNVLHRKTTPPPCAMSRRCLTASYGVCVANLVGCSAPYAGFWRYAVCILWRGVLVLLFFFSLWFDAVSTAQQFFCFFYCWVALLRRALVLLMPKVPKAFRQKRRWLNVLHRKTTPPPCAMSRRCLTASYGVCVANLVGCSAPYAGFWRYVVCILWGGWCILRYGVYN